MLTAESIFALAADDASVKATRGLTSPAKWPTLGADGGAVVKDPVQDAVVWSEYLETVVKERGDWKDLYRAFREQGRARAASR